MVWNRWEGWVAFGKIPKRVRIFIFGVEFLSCVGTRSVKAVALGTGRLFGNQSGVGNVFREQRETEARGGEIVR